jgi:quercetin dioxygenase-like cupin family protein
MNLEKFNFEEVDATEVGKGCKGVCVRWLITKEMGAPHFAMRMFEVQPDGHTPIHSHEWEHEVFVVEGSGMVLSAVGEGPIKEGDVIFMPPNERHQFKNTGSEKLRFLCLIPHIE